MATTVHVPIERYLETIHQDAAPVYVDGEIVHRVVPSFRQGKAQAGFAAVFHSAGRRHPLIVSTETHMRVSPMRVRIPDVAVFVGAETSEPIPASPPAVIVEILSPDDAWSSVMSRLREFHEWGVRHIWLTDPDRREFYLYDGRGVKSVEKLERPEYGVSIGGDDVF
jgi:Uma2 family endonuclease